MIHCTHAAPAREKNRSVRVFVSAGIETPVRIAPHRRVADEWALVLEAQGIASSLRHTAEGLAVCVANAHAERADATLTAYLDENQPAPRRAARPVWIGDGPVSAALLVSAGGLAFFMLTGPWAPQTDWFARGAAAAGPVLSGELWRTVTALTLHSSATHALANSLAGALFFSAVFRLLGPGLGATLVLLAGAGGNLANALLHGPDHVSVGASTAVFGAIGILAGMGVVRRSLGASERRRAWMPVAAGLALLGMLGTGGERTDLWAHALGLLTGGGIAFVTALKLQRPPGLAAQWMLGSLSLGTILGAWAIALSDR